MNVRSFFVSVTDDREGLAARLAGGFGMTPKAALRDAVRARRHRRADRRDAARAAGALGVLLRHRRHAATSSPSLPWWPRSPASERRGRRSRSPARAGSLPSTVSPPSSSASPITHVASRHREKAKEMATRAGAVACGYEDLPAGADVVVVCSAPQCHATHALHAVGAGARGRRREAVSARRSPMPTLLVGERPARIGYAENLAYAPIVQRAHRRGARHRRAAATSRSARCRAGRRGASSSPRTGAAARCSTSASTRSRSRCSPPTSRRRVGVRRRSTAPTTIRPTSMPRSRSRSTSGLRGDRGLELARRRRCPSGSVQTASDTGGGARRAVADAAARAQR